MNHCKLQAGCLLIVLYIAFIYYRESKKTKKPHYNLYDALLFVGFFNIIFDGLTAYTVNHLDTVNHYVNMLAHMMFLLSIDTLVFLLFLYIRRLTGSRAKGRIEALIYLPFILNVIIVIWNINTLEYHSGKYSNYSMGFSAYTCFVMVGVYILLALLTVFSSWNYIESHKRISILTFLLVLLGTSGCQAFFPEILITSVGTTILILGAYMNYEDPAMRTLSHYHKEMVMGFATLIENKDDNTGGHVRRTTEYARLLEEELLRRGYYKDILTKDYRNNLLMAAPMHDIGKIAIPDAILQKPGKLTAEEFEQMKQHTVKGAKIIQDTFDHIGNEQYRKIAYEVARHHHEKWNGRGYPDGLSQTQIPLSARIMAVADVFDAISEKRCYRDAMPAEQCFSIIKDGIGTDFDPVIANAFLDCRPEVEKILSLHRE